MKRETANAGNPTMAGKIASVLCAVLICTLSFPAASYAAPSDTKKAEADAARQKLDDIQNQLNEASDNYYEALEEHDAAVARMDEEQAKIDELSAKIEESQGELRKRAVSMYRADQSTMIDVLLGASSYKEFATTWNLMTMLNEDTTSMISTNKTLKEESEAAYAEYQNQEQIAQQKLDDAENTKNEAETLVSQYQAEVDSLDAEVAQLIEQEKAAEEAAARQQYSNSYSNGGGSSNNGGGGSSTNNGGGSSAPSNAGNTATAQAIVAAAYSQLGVPYVWGGTTPGVGLDCSGLTQYCHRVAGISIARTSSAQGSGGTYVSLSNAQPGDILWMSGHVGIYIGGGAFIHAPQTGDVVKISYNMGMWSHAVRYW